MAPYASAGTFAQLFKKTVLFKKVQRSVVRKQKELSNDCGNVCV